MISQQAKAPQKDPRPRHKSIWQGESNFIWYIFVRMLFGKPFWKEVKNNYTKMHQAEPDIPRQEFSACGLGFVIALSFFWEIVF